MVNREQLPPELNGEEPESLWRHFDAIRKIPHCSGNREGILRYIREVAEGSGHTVLGDATGNLLVRSAGRGGGEGSDPVALQSHVDMVCEKNSGVAHDFAADPIGLRREGEYLYARNTSLGADNGIGVAAMLALLEPGDFRLPPLELLFTVEEEVGLIGAQGLEEGFLKAPRMINLDTEEEGKVYVGCAGGGDASIVLPLNERESVPEGWTPLKVTLSGLKGGHSGIDIHLGRGNALQLLGRHLAPLIREGELLLCDFSGGDKRNAIPREATVRVAAKDAPDFRRRTRDYLNTIRNEYEMREPSLDLTVEEDREGPAAPLGQEESLRFLALLSNLPHGALAYHREIPELVETSCNVASVTMGESSLEIMTNARSSIDSAMEAVRERIALLGHLAGARVEMGITYPGWQPDLNSALLKKSVQVYGELFKTEPEIKAIHAGLETGIIGKKFPGMEMVSIGPDIHSPHSPDERVHVPGVARFWSFLLALLKGL